MPVSYTRYASLEGKTVFITGGGSGIGAAIVEAFVANGSKVAFVDILATESRALVERSSSTGNAPLFIECDLTDIAALRRAISSARERLGPIGVLVNNAANDQREAVDVVTSESWDRAQALNLKHHFFAAQAVYPDMRELGGGSIVNFSSVAWMKGGARMVAYAAAKAAIVGMTTSMAREFGDDNIRVNAIAPGAVMTERQRRLWVSEADMEKFKAGQCLHESLTPDTIAPAVLFLASDDARMITKQCLVVDGGIH
jgi:NAD(P)-dependent dehydrogenase (short-subunit alcohol dehydrogenase family)